MTRPQPPIVAGIIASQYAELVTQYGADVVLEATADALTFYLATVQQGHPASEHRAYLATADAIAAARLAVRAIRRQPRIAPAWTPSAIARRLTGIGGPQ